MLRITSESSESEENNSSKLKVSSEEWRLFEDSILHNAETQTSLCKILTDLKLKSKRGRPRKMQKLVKNPFDFGKCKRKGVSKDNGRIKKAPGLMVAEESRNEDGVDGLERNARRIVESAEYMGLEIKGGKEKAIQCIAKQL
ncbi:hypothetical protein POM88_026300 [Heracleum sosnowskyi]|uniref:Uncharacterized protein n=1 Tax=Heracleum sosnowskyi TaxID=360622 RepID=A0AAD8I6Q5_9APIA|nr:hypothetical protein POM88_026300 [Heracleum sosnowskyi]